MTAIRRIALPAVLAALGASTAGCGRTNDRTARGTVKLFLAAAKDGVSDPDARRQAYALLSEPSRAALRARAQRATEIAGTRYTPADMLVFRFSSDTAATRFDVRERGKQATARIPTARGAPVQLDLVREAGGRWRIVLPNLEAN